MILSQKKTIDQPTKVQKKADVTIGDRKIKTGPTGETVELKQKILVKSNHLRQSRNPRRIFKSFGETTISKSIS